MLDSCLGKAYNTGFRQPAVRSTPSRIPNKMVSDAAHSKRQRVAAVAGSRLEQATGELVFYGQDDGSVTLVYELKGAVRGEEDGSATGRGRHTEQTIKSGKLSTSHDGVRTCRWSLG